MSKLCEGGIRVRKTANFLRTTVKRLLAVLKTLSLIYRSKNTNGIGAEDRLRQAAISGSVREFYPVCGTASGPAKILTKNRQYLGVNCAVSAVERRESVKGKSCTRMVRQVFLHCAVHPEGAPQAVGRLYLCDADGSHRSG